MGCEIVYYSVLSFVDSQTLKTTDLFQQWQIIQERIDRLLTVQ
jgi:hypothetical protein